MAEVSDNAKWWQRDVTPGALLLIAACISFILQNSAVRDAFDTALHAPIGVDFGAFVFQSDVAHFIADGLMAIFFLYVGLELKRECVEGPFRNARTAALPLFGAVGGMVAPALIYLAIAAPSDPGLVRGWAIPTATDIAFALGALSLLGSRIAPGLRLFLLALAIIDDLGAILVIAVFYSDGLTPWALGSAAVLFGAMIALNKAGVTRLWIYWVLGLVLWALVAFSGVHATIAGVLTALAVPMRRRDGSSPLIAAEHWLKPWVLLGIMPIFALANAGAPLDQGWGALLEPVALGVMAGLVLGKPIGIVTATVVAAYALKRPTPAGIRQLVGVSMIAGMGFTMSLFIGGLAFGAGPEAGPVRIGVLCGSLIAAVIGLTLLRLSTSKSRHHDPELAADEDIAEDKGVMDER